MTGATLVLALQTKTVPTLPDAQAAIGLGRRVTRQNGHLKMLCAVAKVPRFLRLHMTGATLVITLQTKTVPILSIAQAAIGLGHRVTRHYGNQPTLSAAA